MISQKQGRRIALLIATLATAAVRNIYRYPVSVVTTISMSLSLCSAWTMESNFRHRWYQGRKSRGIHRLSLAMSTSTPPPAKVTSAVTNATYRDLFPAANTIRNGTMQTGEDSIHKLYYEIHGNGPLIALFLHGGPGAGCFPNHARFFDPSKYTVVLLDQPGSGKSTPQGCIENNTLDYLVEDCEQLRRNIQSQLHNSARKPWDVVLGGSWGATLGLAYYQKYPSALRSLILRGICALRPSEVDWLFGARGGSALELKEAWKNFSEAVAVSVDSENDTNDGRSALHAYYDCLFNVGSNGIVDNALRLAAARSWMTWEMSVTASKSSNNNNQSNSSEGTVLVSSPDYNGGEWRFENILGELKTLSANPQIVASQLRKNIEAGLIEELLPSSPRPVTPVGQTIPLVTSIREASNQATDSSNSSASRFRLPPNYVPAQAMLTCYYSVNDLFVMGNRNLLETSSGASFDNDATPVKIIGIQGGKDPICPPDTALDLLQSLQTSTNNMELRIPLESGHSMYDPAIKHELVMATDRLADEFLNQ